MGIARKTNAATAAKRRAQVIGLVASLPEATTVPVAGLHLSLEVRGRRFGWYLQDHHGDGRLALNLKAAAGVTSSLTAKSPDRFHVPKYVGHLGWLGLWLDFPAPDWSEVKRRLTDAYRLAAPKSLLKVLSATSNPVNS